MMRLKSAITQTTLAIALWTGMLAESAQNQASAKGIANGIVLMPVNDKSGHGGMQGDAFKEFATEHQVLAAAHPRSEWSWELGSSRT
jgi:hypothetical protein